MRVELVYFAGCPHVAGARQRLTEAFTAVGLPPAWQEWDTLDPRTPAQYGQYGSPTILLDRHDVAEGDAVPGMRCVVGGGPGAATIADALRAAR